MNFALGNNKLSYQDTEYTVSLKKTSGEALKSDRLSRVTWWAAQDAAKDLGLPANRIGDEVVKGSFEDIKKGMVQDSSHSEEEWLRMQWKHFLEENAVRTVYYNTQTQNLEFKNPEYEDCQVPLGYATFSKNDLIGGFDVSQGRIFKEALLIRNNYFKDEFVSLKVSDGKIEYDYEAPFANLSDPTLAEAVAAGISEIQSKHAQLDLFAEANLEALPSLIQQQEVKKPTLRM